MRNLMIGLLMAALVFGSSASMALGAESDEPLGSRQALPGPTWFAQRHASTLEEGVLRGSGALLRGAGEAQYYKSLAAINREYARRLYIENRERAAQAYFNLKRVNRYGREELNRPRATAEQLARQAKDRLPAVLTEQQLNRNSGRVTWPMVLMRKPFDHDRELIDVLVVQRSNANAIAPEIDSEIASLTDEMLVTLRENGADLNSTDFITAMKFIKSLNYEVRMHPSPDLNEAVAGTPPLNTVASR